MCSYSSNRYPAETDQQDQEMRNINEEVEGRRAGAGGQGDAEVDSSPLFVIVIPFNSVPAHFILSHFSFPLPSILSDSSFQPVLSSSPPAPPFTDWCDSIHFANSEMLYYIGA